MRQTFRDLALPILTLVLTILLWEGAIIVFNIPKFVIPRPYDIAIEMWNGSKDYLFIRG